MSRLATESVAAAAPPACAVPPAQPSIICASPRGRPAARVSLTAAVEGSEPIQKDLRGVNSEWGPCE